MIRTHKLALEQSYSKELDLDHVVIPRLIVRAAVVVSVFEIGSDGEDSVREILWQTARERDFRLDRTRGRANVLEAKFVNGVYLGLRLGTNEMHISIATGVVRGAAMKRKTARTLCLGRVERSCGCTMEDDTRHSEMVME